MRNYETWRIFFKILVLAILVLAGASLLYQSCAQNPEMTNIEEKKVSEGVCPRCRSGNVGKWEYGLVDNRLNDSTFVDKIRKGHVHLGGCV